MSYSDPPPLPPENRLSDAPDGDPWLNLRHLFRFDAQDVAALASLALMVLFFSLTADSFFQISTITNFLKVNSSLLLMALGLTFVLLCGEIDLSVGAMAVFAACFCGRLFEDTLLGQWGVLPTLGLAAAIGFLTGLITVWTRLGSFIITLAVMFILDGAQLFTTGGASKKQPGFLVQLAQEDLNIGAGLRIPHMTWISLGAVLVAFFVLRYTRFGRYVYMTGGNREAARLAGIRTHWVLISVLTISAVCAAAGGLLHAAKIGQVSAGGNQDLLLPAVACVVLGGTSLFGGVGGVIRTVVGVCIYGTLDIGLPYVNWIDEEARRMLLGVVLLGAMILNGLMAQGRFTKWFRRMTSG